MFYYKMMIQELRELHSNVAIRVLNEVQFCMETKRKQGEYGAVRILSKRDRGS